jgi:hypothetical protein
MIKPYMRSCHMWKWIKKEIKKLRECNGERKRLNEELEACQTIGVSGLQACVDGTVVLQQTITSLNSELSTILVNLENAITQEEISTELAISLQVELNTCRQTNVELTTSNQEQIGGLETQIGNLNIALENCGQELAECTTDLTTMSGLYDNLLVANNECQDGLSEYQQENQRISDLYNQELENSTMCQVDLSNNQIECAQETSRVSELNESCQVSLIENQNSIEEYRDEVIRVAGLYDEQTMLNTECKTTLLQTQDMSATYEQTVADLYVENSRITGLYNTEVTSNVTCQTNIDTLVLDNTRISELYDAEQTISAGYTQEITQLTADNMEISGLYQNEQIDNQTCQDASIAFQKQIQDLMDENTRVQDECVTTSAGYEQEILRLNTENTRTTALYTEAKDAWQTTSIEYENDIERLTTETNRISSLNDACQDTSAECQQEITHIGDMYDDATVAYEQEITMLTSESNRVNDLYNVELENTIACQQEVTRVSGLYDGEVTANASCQQENTRISNLYSAEIETSATCREDITRLSDLRDSETQACQTAASGYQQNIDDLSLENKRVSNLFNSCQVDSAGYQQEVSRISDLYDAEVTASVQYQQEITDLAEDKNRVSDLYSECEANETGYQQEIARLSGVYDAEVTACQTASVGYQQEITSLMEDKNRVSDLYSECEANETGYQQEIARLSGVYDAEVIASVGYQQEITSLIEDKNRVSDLYSECEASGAGYQQEIERLSGVYDAEVKTCQTAAVGYQQEITSLIEDKTRVSDLYSKCEANGTGYQQEIARLSGLYNDEIATSAICQTNLTQSISACDKQYQDQITKCAEQMTGCTDELNSKDSTITLLQTELDLQSTIISNLTEDVTTMKAQLELCNTKSCENEEIPDILAVNVLSQNETSVTIQIITSTAINFKTTSSEFLMNGIQTNPIVQEKRPNTSNLAGVEWFASLPITQTPGSRVAISVKLTCLKSPSYVKTGVGEFVVDETSVTLCGSEQIPVITKIAAVKQDASTVTMHVVTAAPINYNTTAMEFYFNDKLTDPIMETSSSANVLRAALSEQFIRFPITSTPGAKITVEARIVCLASPIYFTSRTTSFTVDSLDPTLCGTSALPIISSLSIQTQVADSVTVIISTDKQIDQNTQKVLFYMNGMEVLPNLEAERQVLRATTTNQQGWRLPIAAPAGSKMTLDVLLVCMENENLRREEKIQFTFSPMSLCGNVNMPVISDVVVLGQSSKTEFTPATATLQVQTLTLVDKLTTKINTYFDDVFMAPIPNNENIRTNAMRAPGENFQFEVTASPGETVQVDTELVCIAEPSNKMLFSTSFVVQNSLACPKDLIILNPSAKDLNYVITVSFNPSVLPPAGESWDFVLLDENKNQLGSTTMSTPTGATERALQTSQVQISTAHSFDPGELKAGWTIAAICNGGYIDPVTDVLVPEFVTTSAVCPSIAELQAPTFVSAVQHGSLVNVKWNSIYQSDGPTDGVIFLIIVDGVAAYTGLTYGKHEITLNVPGIDKTSPTTIHTIDIVAECPGVTSSSVIERVEIPVAPCPLPEASILLNSISPNPDGTKLIKWTLVGGSNVATFTIIIGNTVIKQGITDTFFNIPGSSVGTLTIQAICDGKTVVSDQVYEM